MTSLHFTKMEVSGNDVIVILGSGKPPPDAEISRWAQQLCDRRSGVGADGLVLIEDSIPPLIRMWTPDGAANFCGNGLSAALLRLANESDKPITRARTAAGLLEVHAQAGAKSVSINLGALTTDPTRIPTTLTEWDAGSPAISLSVREHAIDVIPVSTGAAHCVIFEDQFDAAPPPFAETSAAIETHAAFPEGASVLWISGVGQDSIRMRIWKRGVGETPACGTGAVAAVGAAVLSERVAGPIQVITSGGQCRVDFDPETRSGILTTSPRIVFEGAVTL